MYHCLSRKHLTLSGVVLLLTGSYFPLFQRNPDLPHENPIPLGYAIEQSFGIRGFDYLLLLPAGFVVLLLFFDYWRLLQTGVILLTGVFAVAFPIHYLLGSTFGIGTSAIFIPALGLFAVVTGGSLLVITGGLRLITFTENTGNPTPPQR